MIGKKGRQIFIWMVSFTMMLTMLSGCSQAGAKNNQPLTFDEFEEKYKTADFEEFLQNPKDFCSDVSDINHYLRNCKENPFDSWKRGNVPNEELLAQYKKEVRFFNRSFILEGIETKDGKGNTLYFMLAVRMDSGSRDDNYAFAKAIASFILSDHPNNCEIRVSIDESDTTETEIRKIIDNNDMHDFELSIYRSDDSYFASISFNSGSDYYNSTGFASMSMGRK